MSAFSGVVVEVPEKLPAPSDSLNLDSWEPYKAPKLAQKPKLRDYLSGADCPQVAEAERNGSQENGNGMPKLNGNGNSHGDGENGDVMDVDGDKTKEQLEIEEEKLLEEQRQQDMENWSLTPNYSGSEWYQYENEGFVRNNLLIYNYLEILSQISPKKI